MGTYLSTHRFPLVWAVDLLSNRRDIGDIKRERWDLIENGYTFWLDDRPSDTPRKLDLDRYYVRALDAMTGTLHDSLFDEFVHDDHEESDDPRFWAIYGARRIGWDHTDYLLRYSLPSDVQRITDRLGTMTTEDVRDHVDAVIPADAERYGSSVAKQWMREQAVPKLLPTLRRFYDAALREEEIVIYWLGGSPNHSETRSC
jgi:hypothetical protein